MVLLRSSCAPFRFCPGETPSRVRAVTQPEAIPNFSSSGSPCVPASPSLPLAVKAPFFLPSSYSGVFCCAIALLLNCAGAGTTLPFFIRAGDPVATLVSVPDLLTLSGFYSLLLIGSEAFLTEYCSAISSCSGLQNCWSSPFVFCVLYRNGSPAATCTLVLAVLILEPGRASRKASLLLRGV